jgi:hypothetical protein
MGFAGLAGMAAVIDNDPAHEATASRIAALTDALEKTVSGLEVAA